METITTKTDVYKFDELPEDAKEKVIENLSCINVDFEWWDCTYEDASNAGLKLTEFDIDRASYCKGEFYEDAVYTANKQMSICRTIKDEAHPQQAVFEQFYALAA